MGFPAALLRTDEKPTVLTSKLDHSVNFVRGGRFPGFVESRYVRRPGADHFTCYLSTQTGCRQACRMCHLTATKQTDTEDALASEVFQQAETVLAHYDAQIAAGAPPVKAVHFSFMARGEPLASGHFLDMGDRLMQMLSEEAAQRELLPRFLVSTILPKSLPEALAERRGSLSAQFRLTQPFIYYSIYSTNREFRRKWLPNAMEVSAALSLLKEYQDDTGRMPRLHWSLIAGENDHWDRDAGAIADAVDRAGLRVDVNLVRYNAPDASRGAEATEESYEKVATFLRSHWPQARVKVVPRVGYDVFASCGMFVGGT